MTSDAHASTPEEPKPGDLVTVDGRKAVFLYRRDRGAAIRYIDEDETRIVPVRKIKLRTDPPR